MAEVLKRHRIAAARQYYGDAPGWDRSPRVVSFIKTGAARYRLLNELAQAHALAEQRARATISAWLRGMALISANTRGLAERIESGDDVRWMEKQRG